MQNLKADDDKISICSVSYLFFFFLLFAFLFSIIVCLFFSLLTEPFYQLIKEKRQQNMVLMYFFIIIYGSEDKKKCKCAYHFDIHICLVCTCSKAKCDLWNIVGKERIQCCYRKRILSIYIIVYAVSTFFHLASMIVTICVLFPPPCNDNT